jgi:ATP-dependent phosphofructokinase / diphosphate-dependent phosphofructokinase
VPFDPELLAHYLLGDKAANPSNYAMVTVSEGARMVEGEVHEWGEADAYGHRKLGGIGLATGDLLKRLTGQDIVYQQVGYLMRSGAPDALDLMVAVNYANMAINLIDQDAAGSMVVLRNGTYTRVPIDTIMQGVKRVDVDALYDEKAYRPLIRQVDGKPMFLY